MKPIIATVVLMFVGVIGCASRSKADEPSKTSPRPNAITMDHKDADNQVTYHRYHSSSARYSHIGSD